MSPTRAGRPRLRDRRRPGVTVRDEILDAAAELFTTLGYARTSTRTIAEVVGMRQASLYHYFDTKDDILCALLGQTVLPTLRSITALEATRPALSGAEHLHALALFDGTQLLTGRWNLGALYLLPELREARLEPFWSDRERLRRHYLLCGRRIIVDTGVDEAAADFPFRLVESLVAVWSIQPGPDRDALPGQVADACLRVLGIDSEATEKVRSRSVEEVARLSSATS